MKIQTLEDVIRVLRQKKKFFHDRFGVYNIGVFGSFVQGTQTDISDIDIVIDMEKNKKNLHNFLALKRLLEADFDRSVDLGLHHTLKPAVKEKIKGKIKYV